MKIVVECFSDEYLLKCIGISKKKIRHEGNKGKVLEKVKKGYAPIGMIDEDPQSSQPSEMKNYTVKKSAKSIKLLVRNNDDNKKIIQISPRLEEWLLQRAKMNKIFPKNFNLPDDANKLHSIPHIERSKNFQIFLGKLIEADQEIATLRKWIIEELT